MAQFGSGTVGAPDPGRAPEAADRIRPAGDPWTVAIFAGPRSERPLGGGVVIDADRVLTRFAVVRDAHLKRTPIWVEFAKADLVPVQRREVAEVRTGIGAQAAVLVLAEPVPPSVQPAPLRRPEPLALVGEHWWAFGFPPSRHFGEETYGIIGTPLTYGHVALRIEPGRRADEGFAGTGLWSPRYQAVVGIVAEGGAGEIGAAQTLDRIAGELPDEGLSRLAAWTLPDAGDSALAAWGWSLETDAEAVRHWRPRARGVTVDSERGYRFSGRAAALRSIVRWLERREPGRDVLVVTGAPGVGKSAVLGRVVTTADLGVRRALPADDDNVKAEIGSVACAVHAKGKTAMEVVQELATAASTRLPERVDDLLPALRAALRQRGSGRFNIVLDALDEASNVDEVRAITAMLVQIVQTCSDVGAQVVIGTRRKADGVDIIEAIGPAGRVINLDDPEYFADADLTLYALATLQLVGDERTGNPYADPAAAEPVARGIAAKADRNFLIAGLVARTHGMYDTVAVDPQTLEFPTSVDDALAGYLGRLAPVGVIPAALVLTALAYAHGTGFSLAIWEVVLRSMQVPIRRDELAGFTGSAAANFLVEMTRDERGPRYRLFHQALNDSLLKAREQRNLRDHDEAAITHGLIEAGRRSGWAGVDPYLLTALPVHADRTKVLDELMVDDEYLLHADLPLLASLAEKVRSADARARARLLRLTPRAFTAGTPAERAALLSLTQTMERLGPPFAPGGPAGAYRPLWAHVGPRTEQASIESAASRINAMCAVRVDGRSMLANAHEDWTVSLIDPATAGEYSTLRGHSRSVHAVCPIPDRRGARLASAGEDGTVRVWDPASGATLTTITAHVTAMCGIGGAEPMLATVGDARMVSLWDPDSGRQRTTFPTGGPVLRLCPAGTTGRPQLAVFHADTVTIWDPDRGAPSQGPVGPFRLVAACSVLLDTGEYQLIGVAAQGAVLACTAGRPSWETVRRAPEKQPFPGFQFIGVVAVLRPRPLKAPVLVLVLAGSDHKLYVYDTAARATTTLAAVGAKIIAMEPVRINEYVYVATASADGVVRLWDPATGRQERAVTDRSIRALRLLTVDGEPVVAATEADAVRTWQVADGRPGPRSQSGWANPQNGLDLVPGRGTDLLVTAGGRTGTINVFEAGSGRAHRPLSTNGGWVDDVRVIRHGGRAVVATIEEHQVIGLWDVDKRRRATPGWRKPNRFATGARKVTATGVVLWNGHERFATASSNGRFQVWNLGAGREEAVLDLPGGHIVTSFCQVRVGSDALLATGGEDHRIWLLELPSGRPRAELNGHTDTVSAICPVHLGDRSLIMSVSVDRTVQLWDPAAGAALLSIPVYHPAVSCAADGNVLLIGLTAGILAIELTDLPDPTRP